MGIFAGGKAARASGGTVTTAGPYTVHAFTTTGANTFTPATTGFIDILLVGGGGGAGTGPNEAGGGGAGATLFKKMIPVTASTPYPISVGAGGPSGVSGTPTTFIYSGITTTASGGGFGGPDSVNPGPGAPAPTASGGGAGRNGFPAPGGTGAGVYGIGYPGGGNSPPANGNAGGGGGGAGGAGVPGVYVGVPGKGAGGPGVPISYFTGISTDMASVGGAGYPNSIGNVTSPFYGSGGTANNISPHSGKPGVAYIRYI